MKKIILLALPLTMAMISCKKDRKCHCKDTTDYYDPSGNKISTTIVESDIVMENTGKYQAFKACVHTKTTHNYTSGAKMYEDDNYCEVK